MKTALRAEDVLCGDESPVNVLSNDLDAATGEQVVGAPHAVTLRTPDARLIWYTGMTSRTKTSIANLEVLDDWHGYLVRDDYSGWHQFDPHLAECSNAPPTSSATARACSNYTRTGRNGPPRSSPCSAQPPRPS